MTNQTSLEKAARAVLCAVGKPGGYVRQLTEDEQTTLADIGTLPREQWPPQLVDFWATHEERLNEGKATIDEAEPVEEEDSEAPIDAE